MAFVVNNECPICGKTISYEEFKHSGKIGYAETRKHRKSGISVMTYIHMDCVHDSKERRKSHG